MGRIIFKEDRWDSLELDEYREHQVFRAFGEYLKGEKPKGISIETREQVTVVSFENVLAVECGPWNDPYDGAIKVKVADRADVVSFGLRSRDLRFIPRDGYPHLVYQAWLNGTQIEPLLAFSLHQRNCFALDMRQVIHLSLEYPKD